jgi:DNA-directed RNA polymerase specialized sigma subunit
MAQFLPDAHFKAFSKSLQGVILGYGSDDKDFTAKQKAQVENLVKLERKFKRILQNDCRGPAIYKKFIDFIWKAGKNERRNTLYARPFFRERQTVFSKGISPAIQKKSYRSLFKFNINFLFISFVLNAYPWAENSRVRKAAREVYEARKEIIELNMPLAISRARIFRQKTPESYLSYMDLVQISMEGLINAVDKFVLPYTPVFRSVIIGRIVGDLIENYSDTMLHFWPGDKRKIYRANKAQRHQKSEDFDSLSEVVNSGVALDNPTNPSEIQNLVSASTHFSLDSPAPDTDDGEKCTLSDTYSDTEDVRPDVMVEKAQTYRNLYLAMEGLSILENKFLKMRGIQ